MVLFLWRRKVTVTHFKYWKSEKIIVILVALIYRVVAVYKLVVSFLYIICTSFHLHEAYDLGTIISSILHVRTLKHEISNLPEVILLVNKKGLEPWCMRCYSPLFRTRACCHSCLEP